MTRIAFYFNHYTTLGHTTRVFSLVKGIKRKFGKKVDILVFHSGKEQRFFPFRLYSTLYTMPYSIDKRGLFIEDNVNLYRKIVSEGKLDSMLKKRLAFIQSILKRLRPDIFFTEYFPFGQEFWTFEVPYILRYLKDSSKCKIISSVGYLNCIENTYEYIKDFYDLLLIHTPPEFSDHYRFYLQNNRVAQLKKVFVDFSAKMHFTGFVIDPPETQNWVKIRDRYIKKSFKRLILVSRGGGIVNKKIIIASIMAAKNIPDYFFVICCGPATSAQEFRHYRELAKGLRNVELTEMVLPSEFSSYIKAADLSINMSGYNTIVKLFYFGKKTIMIPFNTLEQKWRAHIVKNFLPSRIIRDNDLNVPLLQKYTLDMLTENKTPAKISRDWFSGVYETNRILECLF